jgi:hypothetical protein
LHIEMFRDFEYLEATDLQGTCCLTQECIYMCVGCWMVHQGRTATAKEVVN